MHLMWWVEGSQLRCTANPISAHSGEKALQAPFAVSLFAGISAECLLRALICCCCAGKQASWKGATPAFCTPGDEVDGQDREETAVGLGCRGARSGGVGDHSLSAGMQESAKDKRKTLTSPSPSPTPRTPPQSSAGRILIPESLAAPSMATAALPPALPLPPSSLLLLPAAHSGPQSQASRAGWHTLWAGGQSVHPRRRGKQAFTNPNTKPRQGWTPRMARLCPSWGHRIQGPLKRALKSSGWS